MGTVRCLAGLGARVAGTPSEAKAAGWIEAEFSRLGLANVCHQDFPCLTFGHDFCAVTIRNSRGWEPIGAEPAAHSPPTPPGGIEAELVSVEKVPERSRACRGLMRGKAVLIYASELLQLERLQRVMESGPAAVLTVDDRFPNEWTVAVGFPRYWVSFLTCAVVNIPYRSAWKMVQDRSSLARIELNSYVKESSSQNVVGEVPGTEFPSEIVIVSAHHDSVINNSGADDNSTGVAAVLELAQLFVDAPPRRTLRFVSFGAEEQLSEGARYYASHVPDLDQIQLAVNIDSIGAWMGQTSIYCAGARELRQTVERATRGAGFPGHVVAEISPFSDHFPFNLHGIPTVWYYRKTFSAARHYHHSALETPEIVSAGVLEATVRAQAQLLSRLGNEQPLPFPRRIPAAQMKRLKHLAQEWCGIVASGEELRGR